MGTPVLQVMFHAGVRAVQATPLVSRSGRVLGMFSTHYRQAPQQPSDRGAASPRHPGPPAADLIEQKQSEEALCCREADLEAGDPPYAVHVDPLQP